MKTKSETLYSLRKQIKKLTYECQALRRGVSDYKYRHDLAVSVLGDLAAGWGIKLENGTVCTKRLAADTLIKIAKYPLREAP